MTNTIDFSNLIPNIDGIPFIHFVSTQIDIIIESNFSIFANLYIVLKFLILIVSTIEVTNFTQFKKTVTVRQRFTHELEVE